MKKIIVEGTPQRKISAEEFAKAIGAEPITQKDRAMFPHEEFLKKALQETTISQLVLDLGPLYIAIANTYGDDEDFDKALKVERILTKAAQEIADLGPKVRPPHPLDKPLIVTKKRTVPRDCIEDDFPTQDS